VRRFCAEHKAFSFHARDPEGRGKGARYLRPMFENGPIAFPDLDAMPDAVLDYFEARLQAAVNPYLRTRYADILWERRRRHKHARAAIEAHLAIMEADGEPGNHREAAESARRALSLAFTLRDGKLTEAVVQRTTTVSEGWVEADSEAYSAVLIVERILDNKRFGEAEILRRWANLLKKGLQRENDRYFRREFLTQLVRVFQRLGRPDDAHRCRIQIAEDWESEARERESESWLVAGSLYQSAMKVYAEQGQSDRVEEMKLKARASYKRAEETEFKTLSVEFRVDMTPWDNQIAEWLKLEPADALRHLAGCRDLIPDWDAAERWTAELQEKGSLSQLIPHVTVDDGRPVSGDLNEAGHQLENVRRNYRWHVAVTSVLLARTLSPFRERELLSAESLVGAIEESPVFPADKIEIIRRGFERYASGDHTSAIHVLVPHLEDCLRRLLDMLGGVTTSVRDGKMREKPLDQVLESGEIRRVFALFSDRLWRYFEHVLVAETGLNLRNDVAHGLLRTDELNENNANVIVHLYLLLGLLRAEGTEKA